MTSKLGQIWQYRYFWLTLVKMDLQLRYRRSVLGLGWSLLHPIAMTVVFVFIFSSFMMTDWRAATPYFLSGLVIWEFVSGCILGGCDTFHRNEAFIRQSPLPVDIYPLRTVLGAAIHFSISLIVVVVAVALMTDTGFQVFSILPSVIPGLLLLFGFSWGLCVLAGFLTVFFEDTKHILEVVCRMCFFLTPILYPVSMLEGRGLSWIADYNPVVLYFDLIRTPMLTGEVPELFLYRNAVLLTIGTIVTALLVTRWLDRKLIFRL